MTNLHIAGGTCLLEIIPKNCEDTYISFNEAMCFGSADEIIFSEPFIQKRIQSLNTDKQTYQKVVLDVLAPLMTHTFERIDLYFGEDMFCQINLLTMLAYLEQIHYSNKVYLNKMDESTNTLISQKQIKLGLYLESYQTLVCHRKMPQKQKNEVFKMYLNYETVICEYIKQNLDKENLLIDLMQTFSKYGLGDTQYRALIEKTKTSS